MRIESWRLAPADAGDAGRLALVGAASFLDGFAGIIGGDAMVAHCATKHNAEYYRDLLAPEGSKAWLIEAVPGGAPLGYCVLTPPDLPGAGEGDLEVKRIYTLSQLHGSGAGAAMMAAAIHAAREAGARRLMLGVYAGNERAIGFYRKYGFEPVGKRQFTVGDQVCDDLVMAMTL